MNRRFPTFLKWLLGGLVISAVLVGLLLGAFGMLVARVPEYRVQVQDWINERSGLVVEFEDLSARLRLYGPELVFDQAVVRTPDRTRVVATATRGRVGFDLWRAIREGRLIAGRFSLESPQIGLIRTKEGRIQLLGQSALEERADAKPIAIEQLPTGRFDVEDAIVTFRDEITGRGPWSLSGVNFELTRTPVSLRLDGDASLPESLGSGLEFMAAAEGPLEEYQMLISTFSVNGERLDLAGWADVLPDEWPAPESGEGSVRLSGALVGSEWTRLSAAVDFNNVAAAAPAWSIPLPTAAPMQQPVPPAETDATAEDATAEIDAAEVEAAPPAPALPEMVSYTRAAFVLDARHVNDVWRATLDDLVLERQDAAWRAARIETQWSRSAAGSLRARGKADRIVLENLWPLLAYLPESENLARLRALQARGVLEDVTMSFEAFEQETPPLYEVSARLDDIAFEPVEKAPGLAGLSGELHAAQDGGAWRLDEGEVRFELPRWFREPLAANLQGEISWRPEGDDWVVSGQDLTIENADGRAAARFETKIPGDGGSPVLDISAHAQDVNVSAVRKYLPAGRLTPRTVEWLDQAFVGGRVETADVVLNGPTRLFPFRQDEGEFRVRAHVEGGALSYLPNWTQASEIAADLDFHNEGMHISASSGVVGALRVDGATADIEDLKKAVLVINASGAGDVSDGLQFLKESPLGPKLGEQFARLEGAGAMRTDLRLYVPIKQKEDRDFVVTTHLTDATASLRGLDTEVTGLSGALTVRNTLVAAADLQGRWMGGPVHVSITPEGPDASALTVQGRSAAAQLTSTLALPSSIGLTGTADWRVSTRLSAADSRRAPQVIQLESDTKGLGVGLPEPLGKAPEESRDLQLALEFIDPRNLLARGAFGDVRSLLRLERRTDSWTLDRGSVRADGVTASLPGHRGLRIEGALERFVLDDWLALKGSGEGKPLSTYLQAANVRIAEFGLFGYRWPDVRGVVQATHAGWRIDVSGPDAEGQIIVPEALTGEQLLRATMERLVLNKAPGRSSQERRVEDPRKLPGLQVYVSDLQIGERTIGAVDLKASREPQGVRVDSVTVMSPSMRAEGRGHWFFTADGQQSSLDASVLSDDVAATLRALNYSGFMEARHGEVRADLTWPGGFNGNILEHASGAISLEAEAGQIVNLQPGAGRVLGLLSIAALPRRLALDFSDLTDKGLAFDRVHGDFELRDGHAFTSNLLLSGPAAEIGIAGRTGLGTRDYDQTAVVTGNLGASLPVAGVLAGGPAVGAALLLFSQVFKEPLKGITRGYYRIKGSWDEPNVERIDSAGAAAGGS